MRHWPDSAIRTIMLNFITPIAVFLPVLIVAIIHLHWRKKCRDSTWKERNSRRLILFYVIFAMFMLTGIRYLNPLRWPVTTVRTMMLNHATPVGMTWDELHILVENIPGWRAVAPRTPNPPFIPGRGIRATLMNKNSPYYVPWPEGSEIFVGASGMRGYIGHFRQMFILRLNVYPIWVFDEDGILIDVSMGRQLQK